MKTKHAVKPWEIKWETSIYRADGVCVAIAESTGSEVEVKQNAQLIAAAPELLAALIDAVGDDESLQNPWRVAARAAIAKATGG